MKKTENKTSVQTKSPYEKPVLEKVQIDNEVSLIMASGPTEFTPPGGPF